MIKLESRLPSVGTTIFTVMSRLAADLGAINLSQGYPDFDCDPALVDSVATHMRAGRNQYAPMQGVPPLRQAISAKYQRFYGRTYDPETEVTVTSGGTEALFAAVMATVHPGDEVIVEGHLTLTHDAPVRVSNREQGTGDRERGTGNREP